MNTAGKMRFAAPTLIVMLLAQTQQSSSSLASWFAEFFLPVVLWLFIFVTISMFIYAVLKAPLDALKKGVAVLALATSTTTTTVADINFGEYVLSISSVFWGLLGSVLILLLPLLVILMLYKSFLALVKAK